MPNSKFSFSIPFQAVTYFPYATYQSQFVRSQTTSCSIPANIDKFCITSYASIYIVSTLTRANPFANGWHVCLHLPTFTWLFDEPNLHLPIKHCRKSVCTYKVIVYENERSNSHNNIPAAIYALNLNPKRVAYYCVSSVWMGSVCVCWPCGVIVCFHSGPKATSLGSNQGKRPFILMSTTIYIYRQVSGHVWHPNLRNICAASINIIKFNQNNAVEMLINDLTWVWLWHCLWVEIYSMSYSKVHIIWLSIINRRYWRIRPDCHCVWSGSRGGGNLNHNLWRWNVWFWFGFGKCDNNSGNTPLVHSNDIVYFGNISWIDFD